MRPISFILSYQIASTTFVVSAAGRAPQNYIVKHHIDISISGDWIVNLKVHDRHGDTLIDFVNNDLAT
jgi:hypothetical protein